MDTLRYKTKGGTITISLSEGERLSKNVMRQMMRGEKKYIVDPDVPFADPVEAIQEKFGITLSPVISMMIPRNEKQKLNEGLLEDFLIDQRNRDLRSTRDWVLFPNKSNGKLESGDEMLHPSTIEITSLDGKYMKFEPRDIMARKSFGYREYKKTVGDFRSMFEETFGSVDEGMSLTWEYMRETSIGPLGDIKETSLRNVRQLNMILEMKGEKLTVNKSFPDDHLHVLKSLGYDIQLDEHGEVEVEFEGFSTAKENSKRIASSHQIMMRYYEYDFRDDMTSFEENLKSMKKEKALTESEFYAVCQDIIEMSTGGHTSSGFNHTVKRMYNCVRNDLMMASDETSSMFSYVHFFKEEIIRISEEVIRALNGEANSISMLLVVLEEVYRENNLTMTSSRARKMMTQIKLTHTVDRLSMMDAVMNLKGEMWEEVCYLAHDRLMSDQRSRMSIKEILSSMNEEFEIRDSDITFENVPDMVEQSDDGTLILYEFGLVRDVDLKHEYDSKKYEFLIGNEKLREKMKVVFDITRDDDTSIRMWIARNRMDWKAEAIMRLVRQMRELYKITISNLSPTEMSKWEQKRQLKWENRSLKIPRHPEIPISDDSFKRKIHYLEEKTTKLPKGYITYMYQKSEEGFKTNVQLVTDVIEEFHEQTLGETSSGKSEMQPTTRKTLGMMLDQCEKAAITGESHKPRIDNYSKIPLTYDYVSDDEEVDYSDRFTKLTASISMMPRGKAKTLRYALLDYHMASHGRYIRMRSTGHSKLFAFNLTKPNSPEGRMDIRKNLLGAVESKLNKTVTHAEVCAMIKKEFGEEPGTFELPDLMTQYVEMALMKIDPLWNKSGHELIETLKERANPAEKLRKKQEQQKNIPFDTDTSDVEKLIDWLGEEDEDECNLKIMLNSNWFEVHQNEDRRTETDRFISRCLPKIKFALERCRAVKMLQMMTFIAHTYVKSLPNKLSHGRFVLKRVPHFSCYLFMMLPGNREGAARCVIIRDRELDEKIKTSRNGEPDGTKVSYEFIIDPVTAEWWTGCFAMVVSTSFNYMESMGYAADLIDGDRSVMKTFHEILGGFTYITLMNKREHDVLFTTMRYLILNMQSVCHDPKKLGKKLNQPIRNSVTLYFFKRILKVCRESVDSGVITRDNCLKNMLLGKPNYDGCDMEIEDFMFRKIKSFTPEMLLNMMYRYHLISKEFRNREQIREAVFEKNSKMHVKSELMREEDEMEYNSSMTGLKPGSWSSKEYATFLMKQPKYPWIWSADMCSHFTELGLKGTGLKKNYNWKSKMNTYQTKGFLAKSSSMLKHVPEEKFKVDKNEYMKNTREHEIRRIELDMRKNKISVNDAVPYVTGLIGNMTKDEIQEFEKAVTTKSAMTPSKAFKWVLENRNFVLRVESKEIRRLVSDISYLTQKKMKESEEKLKNAKMMLNEEVRRQKEMRRDDKMTGSMKKVQTPVYEIHKDNIVIVGGEEHLGEEGKEELWRSLHIELSQLEGEVYLQLDERSRTKLAYDILETFDHLSQVVTVKEEFCCLMSMISWCILNGLISITGSKSVNFDIKDGSYSLWREHTGSAFREHVVSKTLIDCITALYGASFHTLINNYMKRTDIVRSLNEISSKLNVMMAASENSEKFKILGMYTEAALTKTRINPRSKAMTYWNATRTKSIMELSKSIINNYLSGKETNLYIDAAQSMLNLHPEVYGQSEKVQHSGERELAIMTPDVRISTAYQEQVATAINLAIENETLSKGAVQDVVVTSVWDFLTNVVREFRTVYPDATDDDILRDMYYSSGSIDNSKWAPAMVTAKFGVVFSKIECLDKQTKRMMMTGMLSTMVKRDEIPSQIWQKLFYGMKDDEWDKTNETVTWMRDRFMETGEIFYEKVLDMKQGIKHECSSTFGCLTLRGILETVMQRMKIAGIAMTTFYRQGSDDQYLMVVTNRKDESEISPYKKLSNEELHTFIHELVIRLKGTTGITQGEKSAITTSVAEFNSEFSFIGRTMAAKQKYLTNQCIISPNRDWGDQQSAISSSMMSQLQNGVSLTCTSLYWACMQSQLYSMTRMWSAVNQIDRPDKVPITLGGCCMPRLNEILYDNVNSSDLQRAVRLCRSGSRKKINFIQNSMNRLEDIQTETRPSMLKLNFRNPRHVDQDRIRQGKAEARELLKAGETFSFTQLEEELLVRCPQTTNMLTLMRLFQALNNNRMLEQLVGPSRLQSMSFFVQKFTGYYGIVGALDVREKVEGYRSKTETRVDAKTYFRIVSESVPHDKRNKMLEMVDDLRVDTSDTAFQILDTPIESVKEYRSTESTRGKIRLRGNESRLSNSLHMVLIYSFFRGRMNLVKSPFIKFEDLMTDEDYLKAEHPDFMRLFKEVVEQGHSPDPDMLGTLLILLKDLESKLASPKRRDLKIMTVVSPGSSGQSVVEAFAKYNVIGGAEMVRTSREKFTLPALSPMTNMDIVRACASMCSAVASSVSMMKSLLSSLARKKVTGSTTLSAACINIAETSRSPRLACEANVVRFLIGDIEEAELLESMRNMNVKVETAIIPGWKDAYRYSHESECALLLIDGRRTKIISSTERIIRDAVHAFETMINESSFGMYFTSVKWSDYYTEHHRVVQIDNAEVKVTRGFGIKLEINDRLMPSIMHVYSRGYGETTVKVSKDSVSLIAFPDKRKIVEYQEKLEGTIGKDTPLGKRMLGRIKRDEQKIEGMTLLKINLSRPIPLKMASNCRRVKEMMVSTEGAQSNDSSLSFRNEDENMSDRMGIVRQIAMTPNEDKEVMSLIVQDADIHLATSISRGEKKPVQEDVINTITRNLPYSIPSGLMFMLCDVDDINIFQSFRMNASSRFPLMKRLEIRIFLMCGFVSNSKRHGVTSSSSEGEEGEEDFRPYMLLKSKDSEARAAGIMYKCIKSMKKVFISDDGTKRWAMICQGTFKDPFIITVKPSDVPDQTYILASRFLEDKRIEKEIGKSVKELRSLIHDKRYEIYVMNKRKDFEPLSKATEELDQLIKKQKRTSEGHFEAKRETESSKVEILSYMSDMESRTDIFEALEDDDLELICKMVSEGKGNIKIYSNPVSSLSAYRELQKDTRVAS